MTVVDQILALEGILRFVDRPPHAYRRCLMEILITDKFMRLAKLRGAFKKIKRKLLPDTVAYVEASLKTTEERISKSHKISDPVLAFDPETADRCEDLTREMIVQMANSLIIF